jgi:hypothetical protein
MGENVLNYLRKWQTIATFIVVMMALTTSLQAAYKELPIDKENESSFNSASRITHSEQIQGLRSIVGFIKTSLDFVRKHPLKTLTIFLTLQNKNSSLQLPGALATYEVANINQTLSYSINGADVSLLDLVLDSPGFSCNATIRLADSNAGNLTSRYMLTSTDTSGGNYQRTSMDLWNGCCSGYVVNKLMGDLVFIPAKNYDKTIILYPAISFFGTAIRRTGVIEIIPLATTTMPSTMLIAQPTTPKIIITSQAPATLLTTTDSTKNMTVGTSSTTSNSFVAVTLSTPLENSSNVPSNSTAITVPVSTVIETSGEFIDPTDTSTIIIIDHTPPYDIIGGAVAGGCLVIGCISAALLAIKFGWCHTQKKSSAIQLQPPAGPHQEVPYDAPIPQEIINNSGYEGLPKPAAGNHYAIDFQIVENAKGVYSNLEEHEI